MKSLLQDLRFALRQLRKFPGFAVVAVLSLALGIGATTAVFSVVYGVLLNPYPYRNADRMMHVQLLSKQYTDRALLVVNRQEYEELLAAKSIEDSFTVRGESQTLTGGDLPATAQVTLNSPNIFTFLGVPPLLGRTFSKTDAPGDDAPPIAVLSYLFWTRQFGGRKDIVGHTLELNRKPYTVIGVLPPRFTWSDADVYLPVPQSSDPRDHRLAFSRLRPGVHYAAAQAELGLLVARWVQQDPQAFPKDLHIQIVSLNEEVLGRFSATLLLLFGSVALLLLVGCGNVSVLLLARGSARQHELAVRSAVGAARSRIIRQLLTESVLLSLLGGIGGVSLAYGGVALIKSWLPHYSFPHEAAIEVSAPVLGVTAAIAFFTGIIFGLSPAWQLSRPEVSQLMTQSGTTRLTGSPQERRVHNLLIGGQVALTMLLLVGAGAATRGFMELYHTPLGFDPEHLLAFQLVPPRAAYPTWEKRANASEQFREAVAHAPGVTSVAISTTWLPPFAAFDAPVEIESKPSAQEQTASLTLISPELFATLRLPVLLGRVFNSAENLRAAHVALVNESAVRRYFGGQNPIGQNVRSPMLKINQPELLTAGNPDGWLEIIGVVADARNEGLDHPPGPAVYLPDTFVLTPDISLIVRTFGDPEATLPSIRRQVRTISSDVVLSNEHSVMWWLWSDAWGRERFAAVLFATFAALALALAATGLYGVVSYAVSQRTREFGLRLAVGARKIDVVRLVLKSAAVTVGAGIGIGMLLSLGLSRIVASWAGGDSRDPMMLLIVAVIFVSIAMAACVMPARRAASIDPMRALRME
jgi:predicted permease